MRCDKKVRDAVAFPEIKKKNYETKFNYSETRRKCQRANSVIQRPDNNFRGQILLSRDQKIFSEIKFIFPRTKKNLEDKFSYSETKLSYLETRKKFSATKLES